MPIQHNHLGRRNDYVMKIYAVKGQNCQNKKFNFPWTTLILKDQNYSTGSPNFVVFHFVGICIFSEKKGKSSKFSVTKWNTFRFKVIFTVDEVPQVLECFSWMQL